MPAGRPSTYTPEIAEAICEGVADGRSLKAICTDEGMPARSSVYLWLAENKIFSDRYARAKADALEDMADEILEIADDGSRDYTQKFGDDGEPIGFVPDYDHIQRSKLRVDTRKWLMSKLAPKKYGDHQQVTVEGQQYHLIEVRVVDATGRLADRDPAPVLTIDRTT